MASRRSKHLNSESAKRGFEERYGKEHGDLVWRETMSKVAREQAAENPGGVKVEKIPGHVSMSANGKREWVRPHEAYIVAHPHSRGEHAGRCSKACRRGEVGHPHRRAPR